MKKRRWMRISFWSFGSLLGVLVVALTFVRCKYGGGNPYSDLSTPPVLPASALEVLAETPLPPGNITSSPDGRIFYNLHPFAKPERFTSSFVFELVDGKPRSYPNEAFQPRLQGALGMTADRQNRLWIVSPAGIEDRPTRLMAFDLAKNELVIDVAFAKGVGPFAQDLRVAPDGKTVYLAETGIFRFTSPALIVFDVESRTTRRVLEDHPSVRPQDWVIRSRGENYRLFYGLVTFAVGVDGVAISADGEWLYYAAMSHDSIYRVRTADLRDRTLPARDLASRVELVGHKPLSDGIEIDAAGTLYVTDVEHGGLARRSPDGTLATLVSSPDIVWADGINITSAGDILFTDSKIPAYIDQLLRSPSRARIEAAAPFRIYRVRPR